MTSRNDIAAILARAIDPVAFQPGGGVGHEAAQAEAFRRAEAVAAWLPGHDREVKSQAWDECVAIFEDRFFAGPTKDMVLGWLDNPYRQGSDHG